MRRRTGERKAWPTAGARFAPADVHLIDAAAARLGQVRGDFISETVMARVRTVLELDRAA